MLTTADADDVWQIKQTVYKKQIVNMNIAGETEHTARIVRINIW